MITITYTNADGLDVAWEVSIAEHGLLIPTTSFSEAKAEDPFAPVEITEHGREYLVTLTTKILPVSVAFDAAMAFCDFTEGGKRFDVDSRTIPGVGKQFVAYRTEKTRQMKMLHRHRYFQLTTNLHVEQILP